MGQCYLRQNENDVRDFAKYDGTLMGLQAIQAILPRGWSSRYTITEDGVTEFRIAREEQELSLEKDLVTFMVVDSFGAIELHDSSSFHFLFNDAPSPSLYDITAGDCFLWGG